MVRRWEDMRDEGREAMITIYCMKKKNLCSILKSTLSEKQNWTESPSSQVWRYTAIILALWKLTKDLKVQASLAYLVKVCCKVKPSQAKPNYQTHYASIKSYFKALLFETQYSNAILNELASICCYRNHFTVKYILEHQ